ncbi:alpha/beta fold hydrolase [Pantoea sp. App145]|uniref:alpha/beta fold hydrolase n=1 Tax=Pantoea sp. App145 TaxID=3071567 RepID=UPI003A7FCEBE
MMKKILFVHGAWQGGWAWEPVINALTSAGCNARALDLPGSGDDNTPVSQVSLDSYAQKIIQEALKFSNRGDIFLVGHSMGGAAVTAAASLAPELFAKIIYVCAFLPQTGESVASLGQLSTELGTPGPIAQYLLDEGVAVLNSDKIAETFFHDYSGPDLGAIIHKFKPQPLAPITTSLVQTEGFERLTKAYIISGEDHAISPLLQKTMAERAGISEIYTLDAGHEPFFTKTSELSKLLIRII